MSAAPVSLSISALTEASGCDPFSRHSVVLILLSVQLKLYDRMRKEAMTVVTLRSDASYRSAEEVPVARGNLPFPGSTRQRHPAAANTQESLRGLSCREIAALGLSAPN